MIKILDSKLEYDLSIVSHIKSYNYSVSERSISWIYNNIDDFILAAHPSEDYQYIKNLSYMILKCECLIYIGLDCLPRNLSQYKDLLEYKEAVNDNIEYILTIIDYNDNCNDKTIHDIYNNFGSYLIKGKPATSSIYFTNAVNNLYKEVGKTPYTLQESIKAFYSIKYSKD